MKIVQVRETKFGDGIPKICVSIIGKTDNEILEQAKLLKKQSVDVVEWRADWFTQIFEWENVQNVIEQLRIILKETPLIFTFRTKEEGGEREIEEKEYESLLTNVAKTGFVDLIDIELFKGNGLAKTLTSFVQTNGGMVILSNHDFIQTPPKEEIVSRLCQMQEIGGDLLKIAVMPQNKKDVLTLLEATVEMREKTTQPLITMSMGKDGMISRLCGEIFGSAMTFGSAQKASAPGQVEIEKLKNILQQLHSIYGEM